MHGLATGIECLPWCGLKWLFALLVGVAEEEGRLISGELAELKERLEGIVEGSGRMLEGR